MFNHTCKAVRQAQYSTCHGMENHVIVGLGIKVNGFSLMNGRAIINYGANMGSLFI
ncbi:MAG: hypothetical protein AAGB24_13200 [Bacteroidota bacterium]